MLDWNVVVSAKERGFTMARDILSEYGRTQRTHYHNVLVMKVSSPADFLAQLEDRLRLNRDLLAYVSRIAPATYAFDFSTPPDFERQVRAVAPSWAMQLAGKKFHVRMHRRGLKGLVVSPVEERFIDEVLLAELNEVGAPGAVRFDDADAIVDVETVDHRAGLALWTRADLERYPFLKPE